MQQSQTSQGVLADGAHDTDAEMFDLAPVSLWLEDYSGLQPALRRLAGDRRHRSARLSAGRYRPRSSLLGLHSSHQGQPQDAVAVRGGRRCASRRQPRPDLSRRHARALISTSWCSSGRASRNSPATPSTTRCPAGASTSSSGTCPARLRKRVGSRAGRDRGRDRARNRAPQACAERGIRARPVRAFAGVALGRGFQRDQAAARRGAAAAASAISACSPTCIRNSSSAA